MTRTGRRFSILFAATAALAKTGSAAARREFLRSARVLAAVALIALVAALALPGAAQAQEADVLVSNIGQTKGGNTLINENFLRAQAFSVPSGDDSTLTSIDILFINTFISASQINSLSASVWSIDASGQPLSSLHTLTNPASIAVDVPASISFTALADATLQAGTTYVLVMHYDLDVPLSDSPGWTFTNSGDEDATSVTSWTIADLGLFRTATDTSWSDAEFAQQIRVNGTAVGGTPSTDATLSGLSLGTGVTLDPIFAPGTLTYAVAVGNAVDEVTVTPTLGDSGATIEYLDGDDATLDDADTVKDDFQVALAVGDTVFKVQVTAEDTTTTQTYAVTVTRAAADTPTVTIAADQPAFTGRLDWVTFTLTRTGDPAAALDVAVALTQDQDLLASGDLAQTVTFGAGNATATLTLFPFVSFQTVTQETTLTATVEAGTGYSPGSPTTASTRIVAADPAVTASIEEAAYTFAEDATDATVAVILRTATGVPSPNTDILVVLSTEEIPGQAVSNVDYTHFSLFLTFQPSDFTSDGAAFTARQEVTLAIVDDLFEEPDETVTLALEPSPGTPEVVALRQADGTACSPDADRCDVTVTITDNDLSTDATLSALSLGTGVTLDPIFAPGTLTYAVAVGNSVDEVTVTPTTTHTNATPEFLNASDTALTDADTVKDDFQVALAVGDTVFKVQVTAEDGTTTETYTVTVNRVAQAQEADVLVSNIDQPVTPGSVDISRFDVVQSFMTGASPSGNFALTSVNLKFAAGGTSPVVTVVTDNSGQPARQPARHARASGVGRCRRQHVHGAPGDHARRRHALFLGHIGRNWCSGLSVHLVDGRGVRYGRRRLDNWRFLSL